MLRPRGITSQGGIVHYKSPAFYFYWSQLSSCFRLWQLTANQQLWRTTINYNLALRVYFGTSLFFLLIGCGHQVCTKSLPSLAEMLQRKYHTRYQESIANITTEGKSRKLRFRQVSLPINPYLNNPTNFFHFGTSRCSLFYVNLINIHRHNLHIICKFVFLSNV